MITSIIFDLNGVFIKSPRLSDRFHDDFGVPIGEFLPALSEIMDKVRLPGAADCYSYWKPYLTKWGIHLGQQEFYDFWFLAEKEDPKLVSIAEMLNKKNVHLFILSNNFRERTEYYMRNFPFITEIFDKAYFSWETGFTKKQREAYKIILDQNHINPQECLFFDDSEDNIKVAHTLGIKAYPYQGLEALEKVLSEYKLLD